MSTSMNAERSNPPGQTRVVPIDPHSSTQLLALLLTVEDAAQLLGIGRTHMYELVLGQAVRSVKIGRRRLVVRSSLHDYVDRLLEHQSAC